MLTRLAALGDLSPLRFAMRGEVFQVRDPITRVGVGELCSPEPERARPSEASGEEGGG